jgi:mono/diheme cytochrome c family protein
MKRYLVVMVLLAAAGLTGAAAFFFWPARLDSVVPGPSQPTGEALLARGEYLTKAADCVACHTAPGGRPFAGGRAFQLSFGTIYAPNITPDRETGLGAWSDAEFIRAVRRGVGRHGEDLYPALPYTSYSLISDDDALAIRAYLASLAPIRSQTTENTLIFPFNQRYLMRGWKLLFLSSRRFERDTSRSENWNRGAYLARALAHCGECHTPRNLLFATKSGSEFAGAVVDGWKAYNITSDRTAGIGGWSDEALASYLSTGHAAGHGGASGSMAEAVDLSLRDLTPSDVAAVIGYLRSIPPQPGMLSAAVESNPPALVASSSWAPPAGEPESQGARIFAGSCASCHGWDGNGQQVANAALRGARTVNDPTGTNLVRVIMEGTKVGSPIGDIAMPGFAGSLSDTEIAAISNYVIGHFSGKTGSVTAADVKSAR